MIKKRLILLLIFALFILTVGFAASADNETVLSDNANAGNWSDVQKVINTAKDNDTIELEGTYLSNGKAITVEKPLTFQGKPNATFDGQGKSRIFKIESKGEILFKNINFINGYSKDGSGGAIFSIYSKITFINCSFTNNYATSGGALCSYDSSICTINSTFTGNSAKWDGGAINTDNSGGSSGLDIINSTFTNNNAEWSGGALYSFYGDYVSIKNSTFENNKGGAADLNGVDTYITDSTFTSNSGGGVSFRGCDWSPELSITSSRFQKNRGNYAGALEIDYGIYADPGTVIKNKKANLKNNIFIANYGRAYGAVYISGNLNMTNTTFENNTGDLAGSLTIDSGNVCLKKSIFSNNSYANIMFRLYQDYTGAVLPGKLTIDKSTYKKSITLDDNLTSIKLIKASSSNVNTFYNSGAPITVKLTNKNTKKPVAGYVLLKIGSKGYTVESNSKGIATFRLAGVNVGTHYVTITSRNTGYYLPIESSKIKVVIKKASTSIKAPKVTAKYKKSKYFKITVKSNKKIVKSLKLKVKVYTGKKYKTYNLKTNKKGIAALNTKKLKIGKHRVVITSGNSNYQVSAKSFITIRK